MTGEELFHKITKQGDNAGYNTRIRGYAQDLRTALFIVGPEELFHSLDEAQRTKKRIELVSINEEAGYEDCFCEPHGIRLVNR